MESITLAPRDTALLHLLADAPASSDHLAEIVEYSRPELTDQLAAFEENGLLWKQADETYALTESGSRVLAVPADHGVDSRIDAPRRVCQAITKQDLRPDREAAVFDAVAFLQYWGEATESELIDGIYSEAPAGYETADKWWQSFMQGTLAGLPDIEPPTADGTVWRYAGTPETEEPTEDGRDPFDGPTTSYGSVKHALEALDLSSDQHTAVHTVFVALRHRTTVTETELKQDVYDQTAAGDTSADEWIQWIETILREVPRIRRIDEQTWHYAGNKVDHAGTSPGSDEHNRPTGTDDTPTTRELGENDACPVCQQPYDGCTHIEASETRLSGWAIPICIKIRPTETPGGATITLYYHDTFGDNT